ncbi:Carbamoyl-phosphate synthase large chain, N-terminal section [groundwater metagenome]|uniref:Carbamoyl-phosphate synthase large chain, N-terminal section n=1 Tax=groundwater metagenome TaxID=717931 RepID=A0A098EC03_9ZZZZ
MEKPKNVLIIGSGPIVIGQAAEFDYSGTQACLTLKEEGIKVILINPNPATIMTDTDIADRVYIEPLTVEILEKIIEREKIDGILPTMGGQTGLNMAMGLQDAGILDKYNVRILGTPVEAIRNGEDRERFANLMKNIGEKIPASKAVSSVEDAKNFAEEISYPVIVRPGFTLGGTGGGIAHNEVELEEIAKKGLYHSFNHQVLIEKSIYGWYEYEYEVVRDNKDNCVIICGMENFDPVGIHTGESIVVVPTQTLTDNDNRVLKEASVKIVRALDVRGGCNVQFGVNPETMERIVIEVNPRMSRSSALASKASGYPIARVATKIAIGKNLDEIPNAITKKTMAFFEPALDYVVVKIPRWPFDKFRTANKQIGTQMKSTGEVMAIGRNFEEAFNKAIRGLDIKKYGLENISSDINEIRKNLIEPTDDRMFYIYSAFEFMSVDEICELTKINKFFIEKMKHIWELEKDGEK